MPALLTAWKCNSRLGRVVPKALEHCGQYHQVQSGEVKCGLVGAGGVRYGQMKSDVAGCGKLGMQSPLQGM